MAHENVHSSSGNYKTRSSKLADQMNLKGATIIYGLKAQAARLPEL